MHDSRVPPARPWAFPGFLLALATLGFVDPVLAVSVEEKSALLPILFHADLDGRFAEPACHDGGAAEPSYAGLLGLLGQARAAAGGDTPPIVLLGGNLATPGLLGRSLIHRGEEGVAKLAKLFAQTPSPSATTTCPSSLACSRAWWMPWRSTPCRSW